MKVRFLISVLLISLAVAFPAFANGGAETPADSGDGLSGTITMVSSATQGNGLQAAFDEFKKTHPGAELDIVTSQTVTDFETMMTGYIAAGELPDMYLAQVGAT